MMGTPVDKPLIYLDNAATTPPYPEVLTRMHEVMMDGWGNPSSPHVVGRRVCVSRASACEENHTTVAPGTWRPKHPLSLQAAGIPLREGKETLRVSFFHQNTPEDVDRFVAVLAQCAREMRES